MASYDTLLFSLAKLELSVPRSSRYLRGPLSYKCLKCPINVDHSHTTDHVTSVVDFYRLKFLFLDPVS